VNSIIALKLELKFATVAAKPYHGRKLHDYNGLKGHLYFM
jgi:hypothetical protein